MLTGCRPALTLLLTATALLSPVAAQTLYTSKTAYSTSETIRVTFKEVPLDHEVGGPRYVVVVPASAPDAQTSALETQYLQSDPDGTVVFRALQPGTYQARLKYMSSMGLVQARTAFTVGMSKAVPTPPNPRPAVPAPTPGGAPVQVPVPAQPAGQAILPANPPMGEYAVYQWNGPGGFVYGYRFSLVDSKRYRVRDNEWGTYAYTASSKRLKFLTGPLKGFEGLYYTKGRNADGPTIALSPSGPVVNLESRANGAYQFGFFRPGGVK
ncbi:hypothetical protein ACFSC4_21195 [Deinococcus malanensis]|nr:hypothetical protein [Deinococcus malanensis]